MKDNYCISLRWVGFFTVQENLGFTTILKQTVAEELKILWVWGCYWSIRKLKIPFFGYDQININQEAAITSNKHII